MDASTPRQIDQYRRHLLRRHPVRTKRAALGFVESLGFCYAFTSGPGALPGLFDVLATRSVDRMWSWAWQWKDELATERRLFYGRVLRRKPTYIALRYLPHFYALSGNVGEPDDYLQAYREGRLSLLAKDLYEFVQRHGPCSTWVLRKEFVPRGERGTAFHRVLGDLQGRFLLAKVGELEEMNSFVWDTFARWMPQVVRSAARLTASRAAASILDRYLHTVGAAAPETIRELFEWPPKMLDEARQATGDHIIDARVDHSSLWAHAEFERWRLRRR